MKNKLFVFTGVIILLSLNSRQANAQSDTPRLEVGAQYTQLDLSGIPGQNTSSGFFSFVGPGSQHGFGGRLVVNLTSILCLESELNFFPNGEYIRPLEEGEALQALFGVKAGKRFKKIGIFGKARPGFMHFSKAPDCPGEDFSSCMTRSRTEFAADIGAVFEYYGTRHLALRVDLGNTIVRYGDFKVVNVADNRGRTVPITGGITNNFQSSFGISYRF
jgi:hypothetical protein